MQKEDRQHLRIVNALENIHRRLWWVLFWLAMIYFVTLGG